MGESEPRTVETTLCVTEQWDADTVGQVLVLGGTNTRGVIPSFCWIGTKVNQIKTLLLATVGAGLSGPGVAEASLRNSSWAAAPLSGDPATRAILTHWVQHRPPATFSWILNAFSDQFRTPLAEHYLASA